MTPERLGLLWGITVFSGAGARLLSVITGLPGVVLLLLSGLLIGRSGLGLVEPLDLGKGLETIVGLLVSLVLFDGGLNLRFPGGAIKSIVLRISSIRLIRNSSPKSIYDSIPMEFRLHGLSIEQPSIDKLLEKGRLLILLDGFDELSPEKRDGVRKDIRSFTSRFPDSKLIMTSRPETHSTGWHQFVEYALSPLSLDKIKTLVSHLDMDDASRIRFLTDLEDSLFESDQK